MKIVVKDAKEFLNFSRAYLEKIQKEIISTIGQDASNSVKEESKGRLEGKLSFIPDGFTINEPKTEKTSQAERETLAYKKTYAKISNKAYVLSLINKKR